MLDNYIKAQEIAEKWSITVRQVQLLCKQDRLVGAIKFGNTWAIPKDTQKPQYLRRKEKYELS